MFSHVSPDARKVLVSMNPKAGARSRTSVVDSLVGLLHHQGLQVDVLTDIERLADRAAAELAAGRLRAVVAAGGDGTAALVADRTPRGTPIALLPLGTENLLSKHLGVTADVEAVCRTVCRGVAVRLDAGKAGDRLFLLMVGCGFDAEVVRRLHHRRTGHIHHLSYAKPILESIRSYQYPALRVYCEPVDAESGERADPRSVSRQRLEGPITARWVFVINVPRYAGGLRIAPEAKGNDGLLDVCTFKEGSFWNGLRYLSGVILGQHRSWSDVVAVRAKRVRIESDEPVPYQLDGDPGGYLPVEIEILPERLTLLAPDDSLGIGAK